MSPHPLVIVGDFNAPGVNWSSLSGSSLFETSLCNLVFNLNLSQEVASPTHTKGNISDLVLTNNPSLISNVSISPQSTSYFQSDHFIVSFSLCVPIPPSSKAVQKYMYVVDYSKIDWEGLDISLEH